MEQPFHRICRRAADSRLARSQRQDRVKILADEVTGITSHRQTADFRTSVAGRQRRKGDFRDRVMRSSARQDLDTTEPAPPW